MTESQAKTILIEKFNVSRETLEKIESYVKLLLKWNKNINLISKKTETKIWERHILDSVQLVPYIFNENILDIGSGGGLPAILLSICLHKDTKIVCIDSDFRKCSFLNDVKLKLGLNIDVVCCRVYDALETANKLNVKLVTARGFKPIKEMLPILKKLNCHGLFLKGEKFEEEILDAKNFYSFDFETFDSITHHKGKIIRITEVK